MFPTGESIQQVIESNATVEKNIIASLKVENLLQSVFSDDPRKKGLANVVSMLWYTHTAISNFDVCNKDHITRFSNTSPVLENRQTIVQMIGEMKDDYFTWLDTWPEQVYFDSHFWEHLLQLLSGETLVKLFSWIYTTQDTIKKAFDATFQSINYSALPFSSSNDCIKDYAQVIQLLEESKNTSSNTLAVRLKILEPEFQALQV